MQYFVRSSIFGYNNIPGFFFFTINFVYNLDIFFIHIPENINFVAGVKYSNQSSLQKINNIQCNSY